MLFNARNLKNNYALFTEYLTNLTQNIIVILNGTWLNETYFYPEKYLSPKHNFFQIQGHQRQELISVGVLPSGFIGTYLQNSEIMAKFSKIRFIQRTKSENSHPL